MNKCFEKCINHIPESRANFHNEIVAGGSHDPCSWRGIHCDGGRITRFIMTSGNWRYDNVFIDMDYLPSTIEELHFNRVYYYNGWVTEHLPRNLRYLCAIGCYNAMDNFTSRPMNLDRLPRHLEELHLTSGRLMPSSGVLVITNLPPTLILCNIKSGFLHKVLIDSDAIPSGIQMLNFYGNGKRTKIKEPFGKALPSCVTQTNVALGRSSERYTRLNREATLILHRLYNQAHAN